MTIENERRKFLYRKGTSKKVKSIRTNFSSFVISSHGVLMQKFNLFDNHFNSLFNLSLKSFSKSYYLIFDII